LDGGGGETPGKSLKGGGAKKGGHSGQKFAEGRKKRGKRRSAGFVGQGWTRAKISRKNAEWVCVGPNVEVFGFSGGGGWQRAYEKTSHPKSTDANNFAGANQPSGEEGGAGETSRNVPKL